MTNPIGKDKVSAIDSIKRANITLLLVGCGLSLYSQLYHFKKNCLAPEKSSV
ncbi:hypothetical protein J5U23_02024 [Saccharolobus shibatae B12]|uniref:Uncharacterized protein n=2 Tax=Saccharolobus shibatae TaxID=2286 RepID=A0A8F5BPW4_SACSH|nr:hypothetical protein J5U23_02024 [Saccharolobus shibatae B12]QXJ32399.1 hypothetical protein J5U21_02050 [Saccharolobus shibatae]